VALGLFLAWEAIFFAFSALFVDISHHFII